MLSHVQLMLICVLRACRRNSFICYFIRSMKNLKYSVFKINLMKLWIYIFFYQLVAQILYFNTFITFLYMFRALLCSSSGEQLHYHSIWYRHSPLVSVHYTGYLRTEQSPKEGDDTRCCGNRITLLKMNTVVLETCRRME